MSNSRDYTITTLRNSVRQHGSASLGGIVVATTMELTQHHEKVIGKKVEM